MKVMGRTENQEENRKTQKLKGLKDFIDFKFMTN